MVEDIEEAIKQKRKIELTTKNMFSSCSDSGHLDFEDVFQMTLLKLSTNKIETNLDGWLYQTAKNIILNLNRVGKNRVMIPIGRTGIFFGELGDYHGYSSDRDQLEKLIITESDCVGDVIRGIDNKVIRNTIINSIKPSQKYLITMLNYYFDGLNQQEIAKKMKVKDATIRNWMFRVRELLKENETLKLYMNNG